MVIMPDIIHARDHFVGRFQAMASPCELLLETDDRALAQRLVTIAAREAARIETKYSRYRTGNPVHRINHSQGYGVKVDAETANLLDYAQRCHTLSEGRFDITSGVLRRAWHFDGSDRVPTPAQVDALLPFVGWQRVRWERPHLILPAGMEIDFGGLGKEYAVDSTAALIAQHTDAGFVVNYGGDLYVSGPRADGSPWHVAIEHPREDRFAPVRYIAASRGGLATSGDARRFLHKDGVRYGHILDPRTGWPIPDAPRSVTVAAATCLEAGMLATFSVLHGREAEPFLQTLGYPYWLT